MRIVFLINSLAGGGAERSLATLLHNSRVELAEHEVMVLLLDKEEERYEIPSGVKKKVLNGKGSLARSATLLFACLRQERPDIVISSLTRSNISNVIVGRWTGHKTIIIEHSNTSGHHSPGVRGKLAKKIIQMCYPRADAVISVSGGIKQCLEAEYGVAKAKSYKIYNPIDVELIREKSKERLTDLPERYVLGVGRLVESKNFELLLRAFAASGYTGDLVILGDGPKAASLQKLAQELNIETRTHFKGFVQNPFAILKRADAFVLSSNDEGLPTTIIEAMVLAVPTISTNCLSGPSELLHEEDWMEVNEVYEAKYGILVPPNNTELLSTAISRIESEEYRESLSRRASAGANRFSLAKTMKEYWSLFTGI